MFKERQNIKDTKEATERLVRDMEAAQLKAKKDAVKLLVDKQYKKLKEEQITGIHGLKAKLKESAKIEAAGNFPWAKKNKKINYGGGVDAIYYDEYDGVEPAKNWLSDKTIIPATDTTAPKVKLPKKKDYKIAEDWVKYNDMIKTEATKAKQNDRKPDYTKIKKPEYRPYKPKEKKYIMDFVNNNPDWDILNSTPDLLSKTDFKKEVKTDMPYDKYVKMWDERHTYLETNPQYLNVSEFLVSKSATKKKEEIEISNFLKSNDIKKVKVNGSLVNVLGAM